ncbi:hypothetical protein ACFW9O_17660 [Streptomyces sp. NPDC059499]|uniref:hypothetical protein n=1 Tax=Streptomyces sp. NPDC059499 TaxID=3346852 RepID=UPI0036AC68A5
MTDTTPTAETARVVVDVDRDGWTKQLQLNIAKLDDNDRGMGFRLAGPKYNGSSTNLLRTELDERDAAEIRAMLDAVFPLPDSAPARQILGTGEQPETVAAPVTIHACPGPDDNGMSPCCHRPPFEFRGERITRDPAFVTCPGPSS